MWSADLDIIATTPTLWSPKLVISRARQYLCGDLRACYCQSCQRDKRIAGEISSMRVNEGRVETLFREGAGPSLALQLNNEDGLSLFCREGGDFIPFHLDQVTD